MGIISWVMVHRYSHLLRATVPLVSIELLILKIIGQVAEFIRGWLVWEKSACTTEQGPPSLQVSV
jgi:hypothetical protein